MRQLQENVVKVLLAAISLTALYDILAINKGQSARDLFTIGVKGFGALQARGSGQKPPAGY